jgi:cephalosporin hydroxylase
MSTALTFAGSPIKIRGKTLSTRSVQRLIQVLSADLSEAAHFWLAARERKLQLARFRSLKSLPEYYDFAADRFGLTQIKDEILEFLAFASPETPRVVCEIGTSKGGTNFLLSQTLPSVSVMIGLDLYINKRLQLKYFSRPSQKIHFIDGSSYDRETVERVRSKLNGREIDLLFIDGDHSYDGVKCDFVAYRRFVRDGGIIAFHDIVEDYETRYGRKTSLWTGDVPRFWNSIKRFYDTKEFVADSNQDGFGIGVIRYSRAVAIPQDL